MSGGLSSVLVGGVDLVERREYLDEISGVCVGGVDVVRRVLAGGVRPDITVMVDWA